MIRQGRPYFLSDSDDHNNHVTETDLHNFM